MSKNSGASVSRRAGHARQLRVHAEIVLEGDRGERLVLGLDFDAFLGLDRLVKPVRPAPTVHHPAGELVDDDDLPLLHDVVDVPLEHHVRLQGLVQVVDDLRVRDVVEVAALDQARLPRASARPFRCRLRSGRRSSASRPSRNPRRRTASRSRRRMYRSDLSSVGPEMISGVRASSIRIESTSSTMAIAERPLDHLVARSISYCRADSRSRARYSSRR